MPETLPPQAVGILYDATLCIGCKSCMVNCKTYNSVPGGALYLKGRDIPYETTHYEKGIWDAPMIFLQRLSMLSRSARAVLQ